MSDDPLFARRGPRERGASLVALCCGALAICLLLVLGLLSLIAWEGLGFFWPRTLVELEVREDDGSLRKVIGSIVDEKPDAERAGEAGEASAPRMRLSVYRGNRKEYGTGYFEWVSEDRIASLSEPEDLLFVERLEGGPLIGRLSQVLEEREDGTRAELGSASDPIALSAVLEERRTDRRAERLEADRFKREELGRISYLENRARLAQRALDLEAQASGRPRDEAAWAALERERERLNADAAVAADRWVRMNTLADRDLAVFVIAEGEAVTVPLSQVLRVVQPNQLGGFDKLWVWFSRAYAFLTENPREANTEGGVFPQIFGTVMMVILMSIFVVPFGVLAALYLREYARQGPLVRAVRIAVNNLAGTPSIVFGVFGWGFFVLLVGGEIDSLFYPERLPQPTFGTGGILWASLTLALLTVPVVIVASEEGLAAVPKDVRAGSLALGATKWETLRRVVLPASSPAILTGMILAMARAAGEVAPLMVVGLQKNAADLAVDFSQPPYVHFDRKFMHLGFHIFDLSYQAPDIEYVRPQVFTSALLLVGLVTLINLVAIVLRNHLRRRYSSSHI